MDYEYSEEWKDEQSRDELDRLSDYHASEYEYMDTCERCEAGYDVFSDCACENMRCSDFKCENAVLCANNEMTPCSYDCMAMLRLRGKK